MRPSLASLASALAGLPSAGRIVVFGSAARGRSAPNDLDVCLLVEDCADWTSAVAAHKETIVQLRELAYQNYGALDPFVLTASILAVRNDDATGWKSAKNADAIKRNIRKDGIPLAQLLERRRHTPGTDDPAGPGETNLDAESLENRDGGKTGLLEALANSVRHTKWGERPDPVAEDVLSNSEFQQLDDVLYGLGIRDLKPLSGGFSSVVLASGDRVVRIGLGALNQRPPIPEVLQVLDSGQVGDLRFEVLPRVDTACLTDGELQAVVEALQERGYAWGDAGTDNIGRYEGRIVVIDSDGLAPSALPRCRLGRIG